MADGEAPAYQVTVLFDGEEVSWNVDMVTEEQARHLSMVLFAEYVDRAMYPTAYKTCANCGQPIQQPDRIDVTINGAIAWNWQRDRNLADLPDNVEPFIPGLGVIRRIKPPK